MLPMFSLKQPPPRGTQVAMAQVTFTRAEKGTMECLFALFCRLLLWGLFGGTPRGDQPFFFGRYIDVTYPYTNYHIRAESLLVVSSFSHALSEYVGTKII